MRRTVTGYAVILGCLLQFGVVQAGDPPEVIAAGEWSEPVSDSRGIAIRGRLVLCRKLLGDTRRDVSVCLELQDASDAAGRSIQLYCDLGRSDFRPENRSGLHCEMRDGANQLVKPVSYIFGGQVPGSEWVSLPCEAMIRLRASPFGVHRPGATTVTPDVNTLWVIADEDTRPYFLSGRFTIDPPADRIPADLDPVWRGTVELPAMQIRNPQH